MPRIYLYSLINIMRTQKQGPCVRNTEPRDSSWPFQSESESLCKPDSLATRRHLDLFTFLAVGSLPAVSRLSLNRGRTMNCMRVFDIID